MVMDEQLTAPEPIEPTLPVVAEPKRHSLRKWMWAVVVLLVIVAGASLYFFTRSHSSLSAVVGQTPTPSSTPEQTAVKLVHLLYPSTTPPGAQNSSDNPVVTAAGHYLELNGKGVLTVDDKTIATNTQIHDAVLSKNGEHYAYLHSSGDPISSSSTVYIDGRQVGTISDATLAAVSNDGKSYLDVQQGSKVTPTTHNTGITQETVELNGSANIVSSDYGFLSEQASGDLKNVLSESRNYGAGTTYYFNSTKLDNCSYTWTGDDPNAPQFGATLSQDGAHTLCVVYYLESAPAGHNLVYEISHMQVFEDDTLALNVTNPILSDQMTDVGYASKGNWLLLGETNAVMPSGVTTPSALLPSLTQADLNPSDANLIQLAYVSPTEYAVYLPATHKLATKGLTLAAMPDMSSFSMSQVDSLEYSATDSTLYVYDQK
jgi:hypothetical protein